MPTRSLYHIIIAIALVAGASRNCHAVSAEVLEVRGPDRLIVDVQGLPISVGLAHLDGERIDTDAATARLQELLTEQQRVSLLYLQAFGLTENGSARVHLRRGSDLVNKILVEEGLAAHQPDADANAAHNKLLASAMQRDAINAALQELFESGAWRSIAATWFGPGSRYQTEIPFQMEPYPR